HDYLHRRVGDLGAAGAPALKEIGVFVIPPGAEFDPAAPWRLQLLVQRPVGALDKAFVSFGLDYRLPERYTKTAPMPAATAPATPAPPGGAAGSATAPAPAAAVPATTPAAAPAAASPQAAEEFPAEPQEPLWVRIWRSKVAALAVLGVMLAVLTLIFFFQDVLVARERLFDRVRLAYLAATLFWLGWVAQAQLSVVNVLTFANALRSGFEWSQFMVDPLIFVLWCSVAASLLLASSGSL